MIQLALPLSEPPPEPPRPSHGDAELLSRLAGRIPDLSGVVLTSNRSRMLSWRRRGGGVELRLHHSFGEAREEVLDAVGVVVTARRGDRGCRRALALLREHFARHAAAAAAVRRPPVTSRGRWHDLEALRDELSERFFAGRLRPEITWGRRRARRRRRGGARTLRLGSWDETLALVRIHPALDQEWVPTVVVRAVVYHEMLHADLGPAERRDGRRCLHGTEFRRRERLLPEHEAVEAWLAAHLDRLLAAARG